MSLNERLLMVLVSGLLSGGTCTGLLVLGGSRPLADTWHFGVVAAMIAMVLVAVGLHPGRR